MKVRSPLADMDLQLGSVSRRGNHLVLESGAGSSIDTEITVSASEVLRTIGLVLSRPAGLVFVLGLPFFWLRERLGLGGSSAGPARNAAPKPVDINKPW
jgi:hypothetical protein